MASLLERLKYIIEDIFGKKTYAESQRDKYKKVGLFIRMCGIENRLKAA